MHCPAHGKTVPFLPILELFRNYFGIEGGDPPDTTRARIESSLVALDPALRDTLPVLYEFMGVGDPQQPAPRVDADARQRQLFEVLHRAIRAQSERGLVFITLIDDLHWIDPGSDLFVAQLVEAFEGSRSVLLLNYRPEYEAAWSRRSHVQQLPLLALRSDSARELARCLLGGDQSVRSLPQRIEAWASGNPFFTEELVQSLREAGHLEGHAGAYRLATDLDRLEVPSSVQSIVAARIDRLPDSAKRVLQQAAVIGREFSGPVLADIAETPEVDLAEAMDRLKSAGFVYEHSLYPVAEYVFKHPISHEVAYESQLQERRAKTHASVARAIEVHDTERLDERSALIALHWDRASRPAEAARWHRRAAIWAYQNDVAASLRHWLRVRDLAGELPEDAKTLSLAAQAHIQILQAGWQLGDSEQAALRCFEAGKALAERAGNVALLARINAAYSVMRGVNLGLPHDYIRYGREAVRLADQTENDGLQGAARVFLGHGYLFAGQHDKVLALTREGLERMSPNSTSRWGLAPRIGLLSARGGALGLTEQNLGEAQRCLDEVMRLSQTQAVREVEIATLNHLTMFAALRGDGRAARDHARAASERADRVGTSLWKCWSAALSGRALLADGHSNRAVAVLQEMIDSAKRERSSGVLIGSALGSLAEALLQQGDLEAGHRRALEAVDYDRTHGLAWDLGPGLALARSSTLRGDEAGARKALDETEGLIQKTGARIFAPPLEERRSEFAEQFGAPASR